MPTHVVDLYRDGATAFSATETNLANLYTNGTPRGGLWLFATHQGVTGGTNDVSTLHSTSVPTSGAYTLTLGGQTTGSLAFNASSTAIKAALLALKNVIIQNVFYPSLPLGSISIASVATGIATGDVAITFQNALGNQPITLTLNVGTLAGGSAYTVTHTTTGVGPTCAITMQVNDDAGTWLTYRRLGTLDVPVWPSYRPTMLVEYPQKYSSITATFGGTGTYKNLQIGLLVFNEGVN